MFRPIAAAVLCAALSACSPRAVEVRTAQITIPELLLNCPAEPTPPQDSMTQKDVALYIVDLRYYGRACEAQLKAVKQLQDESQNNKRVRL